MQLQGDDYFSKSDNAELDALNSLRLSSAETVPAWAVYTLPQAPGSPLGLLQVLLYDGGPQTIYYALGSYQRGTWMWFHATLPDFTGTYALIKNVYSNDASYISSSGDIAVAVVAYDGPSCCVDSVELRYAVKDVYVYNVQATDGTSETEVTVTWDAVPDATGYEVYYRRYDEQVSLQLLDTVSGGDTTAFHHTFDYPPGMQANNRVVYIYFVTAAFADGYFGQLSGWDTGYRDQVPVP